eukprot:4565981-Heterocapsa_arctica.AAC.1
MLGAYWRTALQDKTKAPLLATLQKDLAENKEGVLNKAVAELPTLKQNLRPGACKRLRPTCRFCCGTQQKRQKTITILLSCEIQMSSP